MLSTLAPRRPKFEAPDLPKFEAPKFEAPKFEAPKVPDLPSFSAPSFEAPKFEAPELPKFEAVRPRARVLCGLARASLACARLTVRVLACLPAKIRGSGAALLLRTRAALV